MADAKKRPYGRVYAILGEGDGTTWHEIGPVWRNRDGSLALTLAVMPVAWLDPATPRKLQIRIVEDDR